MWDVLAIAPTDDPKAIRRAYAARLREIDPDRERETFARLRQALEWALASARQPARPAPARDPVPVDEPAPSAAHDVAPVLQPQQDVHVFSTEAPDALRKPPPPRPPVVSQERANERALLIDLDSALRRRDAHAAWQLYVRAAATGAIPLGESERILARLFTVSLEPAALDAATFRELARGFGWDRPQFGSAVDADVRQRVAVRLAAEEWYDGLVATADSKRWWSGRRKSRVARLLLGRIRGRGLLRIDRPALRTTLDTLKPHHAWLHDRISPEWVTTLERRMRRRELIASAWWATFFALLLLDAAWAVIGGMLGLVKDESTIAILILIAVALFLTWGVWVVGKNFIGMWRSPS